MAANWENDPEIARLVEILKGYESRAKEKKDMAIIARDSQTDFTPAPEGLHQAVCVDVVDQGLKDSQWGEKHKVDIRWQIDQPNPDNQGKPFMVIKRYTLSLSEKANLRQDLEAWRGRRFSKEELEGFDLEMLIGVNCQVQIIHNLGDNGKKWANVQAVVPLGKGMAKIQAQDYIRVIDRDNGNGQGAAVQADDEVPF